MRTPETEPDPVNRRQLIERCNSFGGFDLTDSEATDLLNEGRRRWAVRSRFPRKFNAAFGTTVAEQAAYSWPTDFLLPVSVSLAGGEPLEIADRETVRQVEQGNLFLERDRVYYDGPDEEGTRKLHLYPAPTTAGEAIELEWVFEPAALVNDADEPSEYPRTFHPGLAYEAAAVYYEMYEDNPELGQRNLDKAEAHVNALIAYDNERQTAQGVFIPPIIGLTAPA